MSDDVVEQECGVEHRPKTPEGIYGAKILDLANVQFEQELKKRRRRQKIKKPAHHMTTQKRKLQSTYFDTDSKSVPRRPARNYQSNSTKSKSGASGANSKLKTHGDNIAVML